MFKWLWTIFSLGAPERVHHKHNKPLFGLIENNAYWLKYSVFSPQLPCGFCATFPRSAFPTTLFTGYAFFSQLFWLFFPTPTPADYSLSGSFCRYRKALYFWSLGISLYLELFCFLSFITIVLRNLCSGTHRRNPLSTPHRSEATVYLINCYRSISRSFRQF